MREQCSCYNNINICIMQTNSTIHPYHQIEKSKVHQNQPFLKPICYYIRIEERKRERKGRKEEKNRHNIQSYFPRTNLKSRLFQNVKKVPTIGIPKIGPLTLIFGIPEVWNIFEMDRFQEFQQLGLLGQHPDLWNSYTMNNPSLPIPCNQGKM